MTSFWETKYLSAERQIEFLQTEHANTLKLLHEQIGELQKQCSEFSFKLALQAPTIVEKEEFEKHHKTFNVDLKQKDETIDKYNKTIEEKNKIIKALQERVKSLEKRIEIDSKLKDETIKQLKHQVDQQSSQIAQMTFQLHQENQVKFKINKNLTSSSVNNIKEKLETKPINKINMSLPSRIVMKNVDNKIVEENIIKDKCIQTSINDLPDMELISPVVSRGNNQISNNNNNNNNNRSLNNTALTSMRRNSTSSVASSECEKITNVKSQSLKPLPFKATRLKPIQPIQPQPFITAKPFISANIVQLNPRNELTNKQEMNQKRTLPPIPIKTNELAVESPHKANLLHGASDMQTKDQSTI